MVMMEMKTDQQKKMMAVGWVAVFQLQQDWLDPRETFWMR
jgi:hypothetical protein